MTARATVVFYLSQLILLSVPVFTGILGLIIERLVRRAYPTFNRRGILETFVTLGMPVIVWSTSYIRLKPIFLLPFHSVASRSYSFINTLSIVCSIVVGVTFVVFARETLKISSTDD